MVPESTKYYAARQVTARRFYVGSALSRPVSELVALIAGALAFGALLALTIWAVGLGLTPWGN